jgi:hypothetical protein
MTNFMQALNDKTQEQTQTQPNTNGAEKLTAEMILEQARQKDQKDIANILTDLGSILQDDDDVVETFENAASTAAAEIKKTPKLREAIHTTKTDTGFIYGEWELIERKDVKKTYYTIRHTGTSEILAKDLMLRESALAIVKLLNEGMPINSERSFRALNADMKYKSAIFDMANAKRQKSAISEDKYESARSKAVTAKKQATVILEALRLL